MIPKKDKITGYWKFNGNKTSDGKIRDISGNGNHGTIVGNEGYTKNYSGKTSYDFDGSTYVVIPGKVLNNSKRTISVKLFLTEDVQTILCKGAGGTSSEMVIDILSSNNNLRGFSYTTDNSPIIIQKPSAPYINKECTLTLVIDIVGSNNYLYFYYNDELIGLTYTPNSFKLTEDELYIGFRTSSYADLKSDIQAVVTYNDSLSASEVKQLVNNFNMQNEDSPKFIPTVQHQPEYGQSRIIDTGVNMDQSTVVEFKGNVIGTPTPLAKIGTFDGEFCFIGYSGTKFYAATGSGSTTMDFGYFDNKVHTFRMDVPGKKMSIDDQDLTYLGSSPSGRLKLFSTNHELQELPFNMHYVKIWQGGRLVRNFIPHPSGAVKDTVENKIYNPPLPWDYRLEANSSEQFKEESVGSEVLTNPDFSDGSTGWGVIRTPEFGDGYVILPLIEGHSVYQPNKAVANTLYKYEVIAEDVVGNPGLNIGSGNRVMTIKKGVNTCYYKSNSTTFVEVIAGDNSYAKITSISSKPLTLKEGQLIFETKDGITDLAGKHDITNHNAILGKGIQANAQGYIDTGLKLRDYDEFTVDAWVTLNVIDQSYIMNEWSFNNPGRFILYCNSTGIDIEFFLGGTIATYEDPIVNKPYKLTMTRNSDGVINCYVDGEFIGTGTNTNSVSDVTLEVGGTDRIAGRNSDTVIHSVKVHDYVKSAERIKSDYNKEVRYF